MGAAHGLQTGQPCLVVVLADGTLLAPGAFANVVGGTGPQALGAPQIAEGGIRTCADRAVGVITYVNGYELI